MNKKLCSLVIALVFFVLPAFQVQAQVQNPCDGLTIYNLSNKPLDSQVLCQASAQFIAQKYSVYVYLTDQDFSTPQKWSDNRDQIESQLGIYSLSEGTFSDRAVFFGASSNVAAWSKTIDFGDSLLAHISVADASQIKQGFIQRIPSGDFTHNFSQWIQETSTKAFPPPPTPAPPTQTPLPLPTVTPLPPPTAIPTMSSQQIRATSVAVELAQSQAAATTNTIVTILIVLVGLTASALLSVFVFFPMYRRYQRRVQLRQQIVVIRNRVSDLLLTLEGSDDRPGFLHGGDVTQTIVYSLWQAVGGDKQKDQDATFRQHIFDGQDVIRRASELQLKLKHASAPRSDAELTQRVSDWETVYVTIVGSSDSVMELTTEEVERLLDPQLSLDKANITSELAAQLDRINRRLEGEGTLKIKLLAIDPKSAKEDGVLGLMEEVKNLLFELQQAKANAEPELAKARELRDQTAASLVVPSGLTLQQLLTYPDAQLQAAAQALQDQQWLDVKTATDNATQALSQLPELVGHFSQASKDFQSRLKTISQVACYGFQTDMVADKMSSANTDLEAAANAISAGKYSEASELINRANLSSQQAAQVVQDLLDLYQKNAASLVQLSANVATMEAFRASVQPSWVQLRTYPHSNWQEVAANFETATQTLHLLFDDPADTNDLASRIQQLNALQKVEACQKAAEMLQQANVDLHTASSQLSAIVSQLKIVQSAEQSASAALDAASTDLAKSVAYRNRENAKIDPAVDDQISQANAALISARNLFAGRDFTQAAQAISASRQLSQAALSSARNQVGEIDALYQQLATVRSQATDLVKGARNAFHALVAPAQSSTASALVGDAETALKQATLNESRCAGLEDHDLKFALQKAIEAYRATFEAAKQANRQTSQDAINYKQKLDDANQAISDAQSAIDSAQGYVNDSDAGGYGRDTLSQLQNDTLTRIEYGVSYEAMQQRVRQASHIRESASQAESAARSHIRQVEAAREAERQRQAEIARQQRQAAEDSARRMREAAESSRRMSQSMSTRSSSTFSSSRSSSSGMSSRHSG